MIDDDGDMNRAEMVHVGRQWEIFNHTKFMNKAFNLGSVQRYSILSKNSSWHISSNVQLCETQILVWENFDGKYVAGLVWAEVSWFDRSSLEGEEKDTYAGQTNKKGNIELLSHRKLGDWVLQYKIWGAGSEWDIAWKTGSLKLWFKISPPPAPKPPINPFTNS